MNKDFHPVKLQVRIQKSQLKLRIPPRKAPDERGPDQRKKGGRDHRKGVMTSETGPWPVKRKGYDKWKGAMTSERGEREGHDQRWPAEGGSDQLP